MKRALGVVLAFIVMFSTFSLPVSAAPVDTVIENLSSFNEFFSVPTGDIISVFRDAFTQKPQLVFYYNGMSYSVSGSQTECSVKYTNTHIKMDSIQLVDSADDLYECLRSAMLNAETAVNVVITGGNPDNTDFSVLINQIHDRDYIAYMGYKSISVRKFTNKNTDAAAYEIKFTYGYDSATLVEMKKATRDEVAWLALEVFTTGTGEYNLVKSIHDYLVDNTVYAKNSGEQSIYYAYGPLLKGAGVCEGYAEAARLLFDAVGIESVIATGTVDANIPHAWNIVKIGGNWYQLDITWDDPMTADGKNVKTYDYFNITDAEMAVDHVWSGNYPRCTVTDRGVNATQTAIRPQSSEVSAVPSTAQNASKTSTAAATLPKPSKSSILASSAASSIPSSAASFLPPSSLTSPIQSSSAFSAVTSEMIIPALPTFPAGNTQSTPEQARPSEIISTLSKQLNLPVSVVTVLLFAVLAVLALLIIYGILKRKT